jgi:NAD-dependent SIR2 family protein deacetylase
MILTLNCPKCGRVVGDTDRDIDAHINCKRCGAQEIHARVASFNDYLNGAKDAEESNNDESK